MPDPFCFSANRHIWRAAAIQRVIVRGGDLWLDESTHESSPSVARQCRSHKFAPPCTTYRVPHHRAPTTVLRFADFELDEANALLRDGKAVALAPILRLLCALAGQPDALPRRRAARRGLGPPVRHRIGVEDRDQRPAHGARRRCAQTAFHRDRVAARLSLHRAHGRCARRTAAVAIGAFDGRVEVVVCSSVVPTRSRGCSRAWSQACGGQRRSCGSPVSRVSARRR